jgi:phosphohistidine phosphatase
MQKTLGIFRHGKSTWDYNVSDLDRPLKETGVNKTIDIAQKIRKQNITPELIISSPAIRALHTAIIIARELKYPYGKIVINPVIYSDMEKDILQLIKNTDDTINCLFIFGHNPVFTDLSNLYLKKHIENLPTSGAIVLKFDVTHWGEISNKSVQEEQVFFPEKDNI